MGARCNLPLKSLILVIILLTICMHEWQVLMKYIYMYVTVYGKTNLLFLRLIYLELYTCIMMTMQYKCKITMYINTLITKQLHTQRPQNRSRVPSLYCHRETLQEGLKLVLKGKLLN